MEPVIIAEVLDRSGAVHSRHRFTAFPVGVGRGYGNALVLDDEHVSARHGEILLREDGTLVYRDLGSDNGSLVRGEAVEHCVLGPDQTLVLGRTRLRLRTPDFRVPPTVRLAARDEALLQWRPGWAAAIVAALLPALLIGLLNYWHQFNDPQRMKAVGVGLIALLLLAVWAGSWALVGRLFVQQTAFRAHLVVAALGVLAVELLQLVLDPVSALLAEIPGSGALLLALVAAPAVWGLASGLRLATHIRRRQAWMRVLAGCALLSVIMAIMNYADNQEYNDNPDIEMDVQPLPDRWIPATTPEHFFRDARELEQQAQQGP